MQDLIMRGTQKNGFFDEVEMEFASLGIKHCRPTNFQSPTFFGNTGQSSPDHFWIRGIDAEVNVFLKETLSNHALVVLEIINRNSVIVKTTGSKRIIYGINFAK